MRPVTQAEWVEAEDASSENYFHPCDHHDPEQCVTCRGACSCHWRPMSNQEVRKLVGIWFQVSRTHRLLARLPSGKTGKQALLEKEPDREGWVELLGEENATEQYLRCYAPTLPLSVAEFELYRRLGGGVFPRGQEMKTDEIEELYVVLDIETSGLDPNRDVILEVAAIVLDDFKDLGVRARFTQVVACETIPLDTDPFVVEMHTKSGLWETCKGPLFAYPVDIVAENLSAFLRANGAEARNVVLCGNSIQFDRSFLLANETFAKHMTPLLHYRMVDVRTLIIAARAWLPESKHPPKMDAEHRALADCEMSLDTLRSLQAAFQRWE